MALSSGPSKGPEGPEVNSIFLILVRKGSTVEPGNTRQPLKSGQTHLTAKSSEG